MRRKDRVVRKPVRRNDRIIRKPELLDMIGVSHPTIWRWEKVGLFPKRIALGPNSCGWIESEVKKWLEDKATDRPLIQTNDSDS